MKKQIITIACISLGAFSFGQSSVNSAGASVSNTSGSVSFSLGQAAYTSTSNVSGSLSQGVQQAYEIKTLDLNENEFNFSLTTYPNPTLENLNLLVANFHQENLNYKILDFEGKVIDQGVISQKETLIDMKSLPSATYFLEVQNENKKLQTFKIIKNQ